MPAAIALLDVEKVTLVDKIFTMISFGVKYLAKEIKADIPRFYDLFSEILSNKSKHVRKFAA